MFCFWRKNKNKKCVAKCVPRTRTTHCASSSFKFISISPAHHEIRTPENPPEKPKRSKNVSKTGEKENRIVDIPIYAKIHDIPRPCLPLGCPAKPPRKNLQNSKKYPNLNYDFVQKKFQSRKYALNPIVYAKVRENVRESVCI